ncbi:hypothetical protein PVAND_008706 [Polypedilum vanderplanki]|uniref:Uncharacterized protein n=1 Tax=Polypedilum vanderplanki TaxID=319348 RepID=A0A9J6CAM3_POLVA|nr:hypothetical protein PVAND_008706 [Polypedilum vanderplanki]
MENITKYSSESNNLYFGFALYYEIFLSSCSTLATLRLLFSPKIRNIFGIFLLYTAVLPITTTMINIFFPTQYQNYLRLIIKRCDLMVPLIFHVFSILLTFAEYKRRYFLKYAREKWYVIIIAILLHISAMTTDFTFNQKFLISGFIWQDYILYFAPIVTIIEFIILKKLLRRYRAESNDDNNDDESQPLNRYVDINRDEKNFIFQFLFVFMVYLIIDQIIRALRINIDDLNIKSMTFNLLLLSTYFFLDLLLISYVDKRINISILF